MSKILRSGRLAVYLIAASASGYVGMEWYFRRQRQEQFTPLASKLSAEEKRAALEWRPPPRSELINRLKGLTPAGQVMDETEAEFDLLIIGGGATGTGCALDGASRGLKIACVERDDFSSGTSSKSTKLVHGGVRYLEKAFRQLDWDQFLMVREALSERANFLKIAPHLTEQLPIMLPIYKWYMVPYYWVGSKAYDFISGSRGLESSYYLNSTKALEVFPMLRKDSLVGAMVYYDGAQNDARTNVALALTAIQQGATATNYTEVVDLIKEDARDGQPSKIRGAIVKDRISGETFSVRYMIRKLDDPSCQPMVQPSAGTHIIFPSYYSPREMGLVDPSSSDGRVIFFLPWEGSTIVGTTDEPSDVTFEPKASQKEILFIIDEVRKYLDPVMQVRQSDVLAAWSGLRPLVRNPKATTTQELVRNHIITVSAGGLMTVAGGKWTTYRKMAEETIDMAIEEYKLVAKHPHSRTENISLIGAHGYHDKTYIKLIQQFGLETDVAAHLSKSYGDRSTMVAALSKSSGRRWPLYGKRLVPWYPYLESEVHYAVNFEYAQTAVDILARRTRLAHLSCQAAKDALPTIVDIMAGELGWSPDEKTRQTALAEEYLKTCGIDDLNNVRAEFQRQQMERYRSAFTLLQERAGRWDRVPFSKAVSSLEGLAVGDGITAPIEWAAVAKHIDPDNFGTIGFGEFLDAVSFITNKYPASQPPLVVPGSVQVPGTERSNWGA